MLDDPTYIAQFDRSNGLAMIAGQTEQLKQTYQFDIPEVKDLQHIVVAGMGGSALAAEFIKCWQTSLKVPIEIVRGYQLPKHIGPNTLVILSSYSGNTEETLSCYQHALKTGAAIVIMTAGGQLAEYAGSHTHLQVPPGIQPRLAVLYGVKAIATLLEELGLAAGLTDELEAEADWLSEYVLQFAATKPQSANAAKQIAMELVGSTPIIYAGPALSTIAMKWKINFNENSKQVAYWNHLPELNHNEFIGWSTTKDSPFRVVELRSSLDDSRIARRFEVTNQLLSGRKPSPIIVEAVGETHLQQMLSTLLLGDFTSAYLAFLHKIDPIPVDLIEKLKKELA